MTTQSNSPKAIFFDLDGTLADSLPVLRGAYNQFLAQFHLSGTEEEFSSLNGPPLIEVVSRLQVKHVLPGDLHQLQSDYFGIVDAMYQTVSPFPGAREFLEKAKQQGCAIAIVTSNSARRTNAWLESVGFSRLVDLIVSGDEVKHGKPDPEPYLLASRRAGHPRSTAIAIEDSVQGAQSALSAGLKTYLLTRAGEVAADLKGVTQSSSLSDISRDLWQT